MTDELVDRIRRSLRGEGLTGSAEPMEIGAEDAGDPHVPVRTPRGLDVGDAALGLADALLGAPQNLRPSTFAVRMGGESKAVADGKVLLGRALEALGSVTDSRASRSHAEIASGEVSDLGSSNGTQIIRGDDRIVVGSQPVPLMAGDRIVTIEDVLLAEVVELGNSPS